MRRGHPGAVHRGVVGGELRHVVVEHAVAVGHPVEAGLLPLGRAVAVEALVADLREVDVELVVAAAATVGDRRAVAELLDLLLPDLVHQPQHLVDPGRAGRRVLGRGHPVDAEVALALLHRRHGVAVVERVPRAVRGAGQDRPGHLALGGGQVVEGAEQVAHHDGRVEVLARDTVTAVSVGGRPAGDRRLAGEQRLGALEGSRRTLPVGRPGNAGLRGDRGPAVVCRGAQGRGRRRCQAQSQAPDHDRGHQGGGGRSAHLCSPIVEGGSARVVVRPSAGATECRSRTTLDR